MKHKFEPQSELSQFAPQFSDNYTNNRSSGVERPTMHIIDPKKYKLNVPFEYGSFGEDFQNTNMPINEALNEDDFTTTNPKTVDFGNISTVPIEESLEEDNVGSGHPSYASRVTHNRTNTESRMAGDFEVAEDYNEAEDEEEDDEEYKEEKKDHVAELPQGKISVAETLTKLVNKFSENNAARLSVYIF